MSTTESARSTRRSPSDRTDRTTAAAPRDGADADRSAKRSPAKTPTKRQARKMARERRTEAREAKAAMPRKPYPVWVVTAVAFVLPGGGQVLNADPIRGIIMQFFMMLLAFITYMVTSPDISYFGRFAGGFFIYIVSVLDAYSIAKKRSHAWERISTQGHGRAATG